MTKNKQRSFEPAEPTRRQLVRRRERTAQWVVIGVFSGLVAAALGVVVYGALIAPKTQAVAVVNGEKITVETYQGRVRLNYFLAVQNAVLSQGLPLELAQQQIDVNALSQGTLDAMVEELLMRQAAAEMGITVREADVDDQIRLYLGFPPLDRPDSEDDPSATPVPTTPTATSTFVYTLTPSPTLEGESGQVTPTPTRTPTATPVADDPAATPTSEQAAAEIDAAFQEAYAESLAEWQDASGMTEAKIREVFTGLAILEKLYDEVISGVEDTAEHALFAVILVETEEEAQEILDLLEGGADFAELAAERSLDETTAYRGGEVGWITEDQLLSTVPELADFVFSQPLNEPGGPIQSAVGYRVVVVYDRAEAPLNEISLYYRQQQAFQDYRTNLRIDAGEAIEINETWSRFVPSLP